MSDKYTAEYLRRQSACVHIAIEGEPAKDISEGLRAGADYADRLAAYERDLIDKDTGSDRSQDTDWLRAGFLQRGREIERLESECDDHEQARTALEEELAQTKAELREYQKNTIQRDESVPHDAVVWHKGDEFCHWIHLGPIRWGIAEPGQVQKAPSPIMDTTVAPDLRPDTEGPITLPIVDVNI